MRKITNAIAILFMMLAMTAFINKPVLAQDDEAQVEETEEEDDEVDEDSNDTAVAAESDSESDETKLEEGVETSEDAEDIEIDEATLEQMAASGELTEEMILNDPSIYLDAESLQKAKNYDVIFNEMLADDIYPAWVLFKQMSKQMRDKPTVAIYIEENAHIKVTIKANDLMDESISEKDITDEDGGLFVPTVNWKRQALLNADQPGFINFSAIVEINGEVKNRFDKQITFRSVNEAVFGFESEHGYENYGMLFACFVNEDNPRIDQVLGQILAQNPGKSFTGYMAETDEEVMEQIEMVWNYFSQKGTHYSNVTDTSNNGSRITTQYIRFFNQVIDNNQANCIDGTCMLASIFKKIGLDVSIVLIPGHAFLGIKGKEYRKEFDGPQNWFIETTMMGANTNVGAAIEEGNKEYQETYKEHSEDGQMSYISIAEARENGIMPISR